MCICDCRCVCVFVAPMWMLRSTSHFVVHYYYATGCRLSARFMGFMRNLECFLWCLLLMERRWKEDAPEHNLYASGRKSVRWRRRECLWCNWRGCHYQHFPLGSVFFFISFRFVSSSIVCCVLGVCEFFPFTICSDVVLCFVPCALLTPKLSLFFTVLFVLARLSNFIENGSDKLFALDILSDGYTSNAKFFDGIGEAHRRGRRAGMWTGVG